MSKHTGIERLAQSGDIGQLIGWGYLECGSAILNMQKEDGEIVGIKCKPQWAIEAMQSLKDSPIMFYSAMGSLECGFEPANFLVGDGKFAKIQETP